MATAVQTHPSPQNLPLTDGQERVQQREAEAQAAREKSVAEQRKEQMDAGKVTGKAAEAAKDLQELSERDPAAARAHGHARWFDQTSARSGEDALQGHFAVVTDGEYAGRYGVFEEVATADEDNRPVTVVFRTRDDRADRLIVNFDDLERAEAGGRR